MAEAMLDALNALFTWQGVLLLLTGTLIGTVVAILPGLGSPTAMALLLPLTFTMGREDALMFLVCIIGAGGFAGSMTAILLSVPGDETNAATTLDGYQLATQGKAGLAIGASATASALGAIFGALVLVSLIPAMRTLILLLSPPEIFAIALSGVLLIGVVSTGAAVRGLMGGLLGIAAGLIGFNMALGGTRFTFGVLRLYDGIPLVAALIGLFAVPEIIKLMRKEGSVSQTGVIMKGGVRQGMMEVLRRPRLLLQSSAIGTGLGIVPGIGGSVACWIAYFAAVRTSKNPETFGTGRIEGVIAPEAAVDSKDGGQFMPLLALGLPGGVTTAILATGFLVHGIRPGPPMFTSDLSLVFVIVFALIFANITTSAVGLVAANALVRITMVPSSILGPVVIVLGLLGGYAAVRAPFGALVTVIFGVIGYLMMRADYSRPAFIIGLVLVPIMEQNFHVSLQSSRGSYAFLLRPITLSVFILAFIGAVGPSLYKLARRKLAARTEADAPSRVGALAGPSALVTRAGEGDADATAPVMAAGPDRGEVDPRLDLAGAVFITIFSGVLLWQMVGLSGAQRLFPSIFLPPLFLLAVGRTAVLLKRRWSDTFDRGTGLADLYAFAWLLGLLVLVWLIGALPAVAIWLLAFSIGYRRLKGDATTTVRRDVIRGVLMSGLATAAIWYLFVDFLQFRFQSGMFT